jgi:FkbM family methyltransferase
MEGTTWGSVAGMIPLSWKSWVIGSRLEPAAKTIQRAMGFRHRSAHPELAELFLEERRVSEILSRLLTRSSNVLDVGCHIGSFMSQAIHHAPDGHHIAIEASPSKAAWLRRRLPSIRIEQAAISDSVGVAVFEEDIRRPGFSRLQRSHPSTDPVNRYEVNVTTLDELDLPPIDFMKIDIEGAELAALRGGSGFIDSYQPKIMFECGADTNIDLDRRALFEHITGVMNYDVFTFGDFLHNKGPLGFDEFRKCGLYPFRAFNFVALPQ